ncbi:MAG TPA: hypothetical protein VL346_09065 [Acidobacteriaceae bacterium]|jgi:hypothetical protein|nr:hypothetical protein [Acidobacteriaceae bacterium]
MPLLDQLESSQSSIENPRRSNIFRLRGETQAGVLASCANPECASGWLHLLRSRSGPVFEGGWTCSASCTLARMESAVRREMDGHAGDAGGHAAALAHRHRVPLGLVLLEQGWINQEQLRKALTAQRQAGQGRLGAWLMRQGAVSEQQVTRALGLQWNCPVLQVDTLDCEGMPATLPRLFIEAYGAVPLRVAAGKILYLGFEERLDPVVALSLERMLGLQVEMGLIPGSQFAAVQQRLVESAFPRTELIESASEAPLARVLARTLERRKPAAARLVRMHDCLWLRMWHKQPQAPTESAVLEDVICSLVMI